MKRYLLIPIVAFLLFINLSHAAKTDTHNDDYIVFAGNSNPELTQQILFSLKKSLGKAAISTFNDGEIKIHIDESVRNKHVFLVQSTCKSPSGSVNDNIMELFLMARALKRASVGKITAVIPYYGYGRQDRKAESRAPISAADIAMLLESSGIDRVVSIDLHAGQIQGFFQNIPVDNLFASNLMVPYFAQLKLKNPVIVSPDAGGTARAKKFRDRLLKYGINADLAIIVKQRSKPGEIAQASLIGDVKGKQAIIVDDICDTGGTLAKAAEELKKFGAAKVYASITHPVFSNNAVEKLENSEFEEILVTDSIPLTVRTTKIKQISIAPLLADVIDRIHSGRSVSAVFE